MLTAGGCVIATAICLFAVIDGFKSPTGFGAGTQVNLWVVAAFAGAFSAMFTALSFVRTFSVRFDTAGHGVARAAALAGSKLRVGAMAWQDIRSLRERPDDRVLEVRAAEGACSRSRCGW